MRVKSYAYVMAEINDTHAMFDRAGVPRTSHGEKLSLAQRAGILENALTAARIAAHATRRAAEKPAPSDFREFY